MARRDGEADRVWMVNRPLSNLGIKLDNFGAKALKTRKQKARMMADAVQVEPVFTPESFVAGKLTGNFLGTRHPWRFLPRRPRMYPGTCGEIT